jgi:membrane-anchored protein YejM (alkaline phosphatase superfamily)
MHFGVFIDRLVDDDQQAGTVKRQDMFMQIEVAALVTALAAIAFQHLRNGKRRNFAGRRHRG